MHASRMLHRYIPRCLHSVASVHGNLFSDGAFGGGGGVSRDINIELPRPVCVFFLAFSPIGYQEDMNKKKKREKRKSDVGNYEKHSTILFLLNTDEVLRNDLNT